MIGAFGTLLTALIKNPAGLRDAINNRAADRARPFNSPFSSVLPVREVNSYSAQGTGVSDAPALLVPSAVDGEYPVIGGLVLPETWKGETDKYTGSIVMNERDARLLGAALDAASLGRNGSRSPTDVAREYFNTYWLQKARQAAEVTEALAAARAVTSGVFTLTRGVNVLLDLKLPNKINRTGAQNYVQNPGNFWTDDAIARAKLGTVANVFMNDVTFNAIVGGSAEISGIVVESVEVTPEGNQRVNISRLPKRGDGTYDMSARYPDARYRNRVITVVSQTVDTDTVYAEDGSATITRVKLVEDGIIAYHRDAVLGYHHVGPTIEGNGALGRYAGIEQVSATTARMIIAENHVPVVEARDGIFTLKTSLTGA